LTACLAPRPFGVGYAVLCRRPRINMDFLCRTEAIFAVEQSAAPSGDIMEIAMVVRRRRLLGAGRSPNNTDSSYRANLVVGLLAGLAIIAYFVASYFAFAPRLSPSAADLPRAERLAPRPSEVASQFRRF
jgi:hypothetical protein